MLAEPRQSSLARTTHVYPDRLRLPLSFDAARLRGDLDALAGAGEAWTRHFVPQNFDGDWSVVPLRATKGATHPIMMIYSDPNATEWVDTPFLDAMPYIRDVLAAFDCPITTVRLMRLTPGSVIKEHNDNDLEAEQGVARLHIPVATNAGVDFRLNGERVTMREGSTWYLRLSDPHSVTNAGDEDRVHLVIDCQVNDWLTAQLKAGVAA